ncbi:transposable element Tcb1 transposase [Trichonephila clavipes]|nr:transposable element Tcb1 transposase [Trichonephila clavipes]
MISQETNSIRNKSGNGRKIYTTSTGAMTNKRLCLQYRIMLSTVIRSDLNDVCVPVSSRTSRKRLKYVGLRGRMPRKKPNYNLQWANEHINWTGDQWSQVTWSDETCDVLRVFSLTSPLGSLGQN